MRNAIRTLQRYLDESGLYRPVHMSVARRPAWMLRLGVPLSLAAASVLGWYVTTAKPAPAAASAQVRANPAEETPAAGLTDTKLETTQSINSEGMITDRSVTINSESIPIPDNGSVHRVIQDDSGTTTVDISVDSQTGGTSDNTTNMKLEINSRSTTDIEHTKNTSEGP